MSSIQRQSARFFCEKAALKNFFQNSKKKARLLLIIRLKKGEIRKTVGSLTNSLL